jgi:hypothetical protein
VQAWTVAAARAIEHRRASAGERAAASPLERRLLGTLAA